MQDSRGGPIKLSLMLLNQAAMSKVWFTSGGGSAASLRRLLRQPLRQTVAATSIQITFSRFIRENLTFIYETRKKPPNYIALILNNILSIHGDG
ncbi:hypothetical protein ACQFN5_22370 [Klebsiella sp. WOUb02]|uniref:hypothetical protein n=1 Tax=Klebsiella sp. WOUb02 TaxID=3161071 RepID=UPI003CF3B1A4